MTKKSLLSERTAVLDASPLILLSRAGFLDLLDVLERKIVVPLAVRDEVAVKGLEDISAKSLMLSEAIQMLPVPEIPRRIASWELGAGESSVLAWALDRPDALAVLDDLEARRCARTLSVPVVGTAGLVLAAKRRGVISRARPVLEALIESGMYLSNRTLGMILSKVDES